MRHPASIEPVVVQTHDIRLSALLARPAREPARGLIVALPGGGYTAGYWNSPVEGQSFLQVAAELGFIGLALDRPGYGASLGFDPDRLHVADQVGLVFDAIAAWTAKNRFEGPVFLIGHSLGGMVALAMAADPRGASLAGVDVMGVPFRYRDDGGGAAVQRLARTQPYVPSPSEDLQRVLLFGPAGSYTPEAFAHHQACLHPMPLAEYEDGMAAPDTWPRVLPAIVAPVQFTVAEHETMQCTGWGILDEVRGLLRRSAAVRVEFLEGSGHNASLHAIARAYHLRALAFFEAQLALGR